MFRARGPHKWFGVILGGSAHNIIGIGGPRVVGYAFVVIIMYHAKENSIFEVQTQIGKYNVF